MFIKILFPLHVALLEGTIIRTSSCLLLTTSFIFCGLKMHLD